MNQKKTEGAHQWWISQTVSERLKCLRHFFMLSTAGGMEITLTVVYMTVQEAASLAGKHNMSYMFVCDCLISANWNHHVYYGQQLCVVIVLDIQCMIFLYPFSQGRVQTLLLNLCKWRSWTKGSMVSKWEWIDVLIIIILAVSLIPLSKLVLNGMSV